MQYPNPLNFLRRCSKAEHYDLASRTLAKYIMESTLLDHRFISIVPSLLAASGTFLARKMLNRGAWDANLAHYSGYSQEQVEVVSKLMVKHLSEPRALDSIHKKYSTKRYMKSSTFVDNWIEKHPEFVRIAALSSEDVEEDDDDEEQQDEESQEDSDASSNGF